MNTARILEFKVKGRSMSVHLPAKLDEVIESSEMCLV